MQDTDTREQAQPQFLTAEQAISRLRTWIEEPSDTLASRVIQAAFALVDDKPGAAAILSDAVNPRVWRLVDKNEPECWLWRGARDSKGYATHEGLKLHRVFCELSGQPVDGLVVHHTCRVKHCVNPDHLEALTRSDHGTKHYREANP